MKNIMGILFLTSMFFVVTACGGNVFNEDSIKEFVMEYKTDQYTVKNPSNPPTAVEIGERVKPYLSEEEYNSFMTNRYFNIITVVAKNTRKSIEVQDVVLEKVEENEDGSIDYNYTLQLKYYDNHFEDIIEKEGQMTIQHNGQYIITRDWEKPNQYEQDAILNQGNEN
ncbi:hypothetical protein [Ornithinibacillus xuwenensis]|uniref:Uncharacterized protein n=1 Tax=Ornithinibacillus xuwenensis TaxID=3144668 RepID=A0ABU9XDC4_9BACI